MEAWLDRAAELFDRLDGALEAFEVRFGFPFTWILFALAGIGFVLRIAHVVAIARAHGAMPAGSKPPPAPIVRTERGATIREDRNLATAGRATDATPAPRAAAFVLAAFGFAILAAGVAWIVVEWRTPSAWRPNAFLFGSLVALVGAGLVRAGLGGIRAPGEPDADDWLRAARWTRDGTGPVASERVGQGTLGLVLLGAFLLAFHTVFAAPLSSWGFWATIALLDLLFVVALVFLAQSTVSWMRSGRARLLWTSAPFAPGDVLRVRFTTAKRLGEEVTVVVRCLRGGGSALPLDHEPPPDVREIYSDARSFRLRRDPAAGSWVDLAIPIPAHAPPSVRGADESIWWRLVVRAAASGPDFEVTFPLPVLAKGQR